MKADFIIHKYNLKVGKLIVGELVTLLKAFSQLIVVHEDVFCLSLTLIIGFVKDERGFWKKYSALQAFFPQFCTET